MEVNNTMELANTNAEQRTLPDVLADPDGGCRGPLLEGWATDGVAPVRVGALVVLVGAVTTGALKLAEGGRTREEL